MEKGYFKYRFDNDFDFNLDEGKFYTIIGNNNDLIIHTLVNGNNKVNIFIGDKEFNKENINIIRRRMSIVLYKHLNIFVGENVCDEIAFSLEGLAYSKDDIRELIDSQSKTFKLDHLLNKDPNSLGSSDRVKMKILSALIIKPKILVIDNILCELDSSDKELIFDILKRYVNEGGIVLNVTNDIEETLHSDDLFIIYDKKIICEGKTLSVLNEEKILKRLSLGMPFIVELNKYLMDYGLIDKYYLSNERLIDAVWK